MPSDVKDLRECPVCGLPVGLLSRNEGYISLGCDTCHVSRTVTVDEWNRAIESANRPSGFEWQGADRRKLDIPVAQDRRQRLAT
jgi:hypothetical protein